MAEKDKTDEKTSGLTRRDFLKVAGVAGAAGGVASVVDWVATAPNPVFAAAVDNNYDLITTCPYCSVGCNMKIGLAAGKVVDIIGDPDCPINKGALCSKGAASIQLVNNERRVGVADSIHAASRTYGPMMRTGNGAWTAISWDDALSGIATAMLAARTTGGGVPIAGGKVTGSANGVAFFGCSHATNEENWIYRKMIANFGTNNVEHQARI